MSNDPVDRSDLTRPPSSLFSGGACLDVYQTNDSLDLVELYFCEQITNSPPDLVSTTGADLDTLGMEGVGVLRRALLVL